MDQVQLTAGAVKRYMDASNAGDEASLAGFYPVVQLLNIKRVVAKNDGPPRNRLIVSDGVHFAQAMLATQKNFLVDEGLIVRNSVVTLKSCHTNILGGKRLLIVMDLEPGEQLEGKIGEPKNIEHEDDTTAQSFAAPSTAPSATAVNPTSTPSVTLVNPPSARPSASRSGPSGAPTGLTFPLYPIENLSPYQNKWTIKARVTHKSDMKHFSNARGDGKLFNVTLADETGEIRATAFNTVADELYERLQEGRVYFISKARVNIAKRKFGASNEFEISLERNTEVEECLDTTNMPAIKFTFVELNKLEQAENNAIIDVIGVVNEVGDVTELTSKAGRQLTKRDVTLVDQTGYSVRLTLWGKDAENFSAPNHPVVAFKGVKVGDFGGRTLSAISGTTCHLNLDREEAHILRGWYDSQGQSIIFQTQSAGGGATSGNNQLRREELMTLGGVRDSSLGSDENAGYFSCRATITNIKSDSVSYTACPGDRCNKKVTETENGWRCEKCDRSYPEPDYRYLMSLQVADHTAQLWFQAFNEIGQQIMGMTAKELYALECEDRKAAEAAIESAQGRTYNFNCRAKQDRFNETVRTRYGINRLWPLDYVVESDALLNILKQY
ncbi:Replication factor A protein 1 [Tulasnella sp. 403]|nr:Replication factor A protein 1 [Tulasnella sp. 403]